MAFTSLPLLARACAVVCVAIGALHAPVAQAVATSDIFVNPANGHQYLLLDHATWTASEGMAITQGGHLVTINNGAENDWVYNTFEPMLPRDGGSNSLWIGLNDAQVPGHYVWANGEAVTYTNWIFNQPDGAYTGEHYAHLFNPTFNPDSRYWRQWNDLRDDIPIAMYGIVEGITLVRGGTALVLPEPGQAPLLIAGLVIGWLGMRLREGRA